MILKQSTAAALTVGPILDSAGAEYASAVIADISVSKNGATPSALAAAATLVYAANGYYTLTLIDGNVDTVGTVQFTVNKSTYQMPPVNCNVIEETIYDALYAASATGLLPANMTQLGGDTQSATDLKDFADAGYDPATHKVQGVVLVDTTTNNSDMRGTDSAALATALATHDGKLDTADAAIDAVASYLTTNVGANGANLSVVNSAIAGLPVAIEAALINEGDGQQLIDAILTVINSNLDLPALELTAIAAAVRTELTTELARIDAAISSRLAAGSYTAPDNAGIAAIDTKLGTPAADVSADLAAIDTKLGTPDADIAADVAAIKADTATLLGRITSAVGSMLSALVSMISAGKFTATALENTPAASVDLTPVTDELAKVPRSDTAIAAGSEYTLTNQDAEEITISIRTGA